MSQPPQNYSFHPSGYRPPSSPSSSPAGYKIPPHKVTKATSSSSSPSSAKKTYPYSSSLPPQRAQPPPHAQPAPGMVPGQPPHLTFSRKRKLVERRLPPNLEKTVPESALFTRLVDFEKRLDAVIMRKRYDIQDALRKPAKVKRVLRVFLSNLAHNQAWSRPDNMLGFGIQENPEDAPSWTFKIEGRVLEAKGRAGVPRKFSSFFRSIIVEFDRNQMSSDNNIVEWYHPPQGDSSEWDGFEIKRRGDTNVDVKIILNPLHLPDKFRVAPELASVLGIHTETKADIISALWRYIKANQLQDQEKRTQINADENLSRVLNLKYFDLAAIPRIIQPFLLPPEPIVLNYTINTDQAMTTSPVAFDVDVEFEEARQNMSNFLLSANSARDLNDHEQKIMSTIRLINGAKRKREFLQEFIDSPVDFINRWIESQSADLKELQGEKEVEREEMRPSSYYQQPWFEEAALHFLHSKDQEKINDLYQKTRPK